MAEAQKVISIVKKGSSPSNEVISNEAANEIIFAVVGHVGSGTSAIAIVLKDLLEQNQVGIGAYDVSIIKARDVIKDWAVVNGKPIPPDSEKKLVASVEIFQNLGDEMRRSEADNAAVAVGLVKKIRATRAQRLDVPLEDDTVVIPDGKRRAYVLDSIRHAAEVELLRHIYQDAFFLVGVVCEMNTRLERVLEKYSADCGRDKAKEFMRRDEKAKEKHGQRVSEAFHMADFFVDNTANQNVAGSPNPAWDVNDKLSRLAKIIRSSEIIRPEMSETAMLHAHTASLRSACLSRQVGAALIDRLGNVVSTGTNEVPRAGGGVYGEGFPDGHEDDHRCAYRKLPDGKSPYCSNTREQQTIATEILKDILDVVQIPPDKQSLIEGVLRHGRISLLLEFSRAIHAEMDALLTAARKGISTTGTRLFVTTFPCHYCARHLVASGVDEVQYIEPYPKSQALELHSDSIQVTADNWRIPSGRVFSSLGEDSNSIHNSNPAKVLFRPFTGVAPRLYRRAFIKDRDLKDSDSGVMNIGVPTWGSQWHLRRKSYPQLEAQLAGEVKN